MSEPTHPGNEEQRSATVAVAVSSVRAPFPGAYSEDERSTARVLAKVVGDARVPNVGVLVLTQPPDDNEDDPIGFKRVVSRPALTYCMQALRTCYDDSGLALRS